MRLMFFGERLFLAFGHHPMNAGRVDDVITDLKPYLRLEAVATCPASKSSEQRAFGGVFGFGHGTVPDQPHLARRGGTRAGRRDSVAGVIRQPPGLRAPDLPGVFVFRRGRAASGFGVPEGAVGAGRGGVGDRPAAAGRPGD